MLRFHALLCNVVHSGATAAGCRVSVADLQAPTPFDDAGFQVETLKSSLSHAADGVWILQDPAGSKDSHSSGRCASYIEQNTFACSNDDDAEALFLGVQEWMLQPGSGLYTATRTDDHLASIVHEAGGVIVAARASDALAHYKASENALLDTSRSIGVGFRIRNVVYFVRGEALMGVDSADQHVLNMATRIATQLAMAGPAAAA